MADRATRPIEVQLAGTVIGKKSLHMAGGCQLHRLGVTCGAAIRRVDLRVADQAVGHLGEVRVSDFLAFL